MQRSDKLKAGKIDVDVPLVETLIAAQFPQWRELKVRAVAEDGWDNWTFRLGDRLKVRLPSADGSAGQAGKEAHWLPRLAPLLPVPVPIPVALGEPGEGYPLRWSVYSWIDGAPATRQGIDDLSRFAGDVARFIRALQAIDTSGGPPPGQHNFFRGAPPVAIYGEEARRSIAACARQIDAATAYAVLEAAEAAPFEEAPRWLHGDIASGNLLVQDGALSAVIDFGGLAIGDPACDLVIAWGFFDGEARERFRSEVNADAGMWARARAWAVWKSALLLSRGAPTHPAEATPLQILEAVLEEHRAVG